MPEGWTLGGRYGVGMVFLSRETAKAEAAQTIIDEELERETLSVLGWRQVPVDPEVLGDDARQTLPRIVQVLFNGPFGWGSKDLERRLYMVKRRVEKRVTDDPDFYIASLSDLVIVYKGLCRPVDLPRFFPDLADIRMQSAICLFHQRFSTNTLPSGRWRIRSAISPTTARSTPSPATAVGRVPLLQVPLAAAAGPAEAAPLVNMHGSDSSDARQHARGAADRRHGPASRPCAC